MKYFKILLVLSLGCLITACGKSSSNDGYNGTVTDLSKGYLAKGYIVNMFRTATPISEDVEDMGKSYITMGFQVLAEYTSTYDYSADAGYNIKKVTVTNVKVAATPKMGMVEDLSILKQYSTNLGSPHVTVKSTESKYEVELTTPTATGQQMALWANLNRIALFNENTSQVVKTYGNPTTEQIYNELGITRDEIAFKIKFRIELLTVSDEVLYYDYEAVVPPVAASITGSEYNFQVMETDTGKMKPFYEKE